MPNYYGYQPQRNSNSAQHGLFKYIKREWKNGKWRYYYDDVKKNVNNFVDTKVTGKTAKANIRKSATDSRVAKAGFKRSLTDRNLNNDDARKQYVSDRKEVTTANKNRQYAKKMLPGHMDKADANVKKAVDTMTANKNSFKKTSSTLEKQAADYAKDYQKAETNKKKYQAEYDKTVAGKVDTAKKAVKDTYVEAEKQVKKAADEVADWANETYKDVSERASQAIDAGSDWVKNLLGGKKKKKK